MFNNDLLRDLAEDKVVLFLGAGVSASSLIDGGPAFKGWPAFLKYAAESRESNLRDQIIGLVDGKDYLLACQILQDDYEDEWQELIMAEYGKAAEPSRLHRSLISLGQRLIVTTNFDKLIETAWSQSIPAGSRAFKVISTIDENVFRCLKDYDTPYLIKIHGSVDNTSSLVFSRSEYIKLAFGNNRYSSFLDAILLNYTFLFIGFSMDDPAISSLMEMYALNYPGARPHYIVTPEGGHENIAEINKKLRKLSMIKYDSSNGHAKLPDLIDDLARAANAKRRDILATKFGMVGITH
ncbi:SIR2 family protein [Burkholderia vietnamiensis]|uniref:SIR2 family protein n=1 Tax=Burkholderia vietnamiensis TaxID=60552 RepID=UPI001B9B0D42|nr:SIR2 family protein [Burkholderia vietnamiensis]MBR8032438.1 SIR2 family protein [Burkholderia vietnamiensis]